jgi:hypothetical protein
MAPQARRGARACFNGVAHQEIAYVFEFALNRIGMPLFDGQATALIMAI